MDKSRDGNTENECPTKEFSPGEACGQCWGDGHYKCVECINYRKDFKEGGLEYVSDMHQPNRGIIIISSISTTNPLCTTKPTTK